MRMRAISEAITAPASTDAVKVIEQQLATLAGMPEAEVAERVNQPFTNARTSGVAGQGGASTGTVNAIRARRNRRPTSRTGR